jgi:hypothetical protein
MTAPTIAPPEVALTDAIAALDRLVAGAAVAYREPRWNPASNLPHRSDLRDTQLGRHALEALALAAGPRVQLVRPYAHRCYALPCQAIGVAVGISAMTGYIYVRFDCGRSGTFPAERLALLDLGAAWRAERDAGTNRCIACGNTAYVESIDTGAGVETWCSDGVGCQADAR